MKKRLQTIINSFAVLSLVTVISACIFAPAALAAPSNPNAVQVCEGVRITGGNCDQEAPGTGVSGIIKTVVNILSLIVGVAAVVMIIIGGLKYVTSSGDSNNVNSAKNTILYAIIGLVVTALAQIIVRFVFNRVK